MSTFRARRFRCRVAVAVSALAAATVLVFAARGPGGPAYAAGQSAKACRWRSAPPVYRGGELEAVAGDAPDDVWAVGYVEGSGYSAAFHWNGRFWQRLSLGKGELRSVAVFSPTDVWAVGLARSNGWIVHWNGRRWRHVPLPSNALDSSLWSVAGLGPDDVWTVGTTLAGSNSLLALHWNGRRWRRVPMPDPGADTYVSGVAARTPSDAWAVGQTGSGDDLRPLIWHWNGTRWNLLLLADRAQLAGQPLERVAIVSRDDAWAASGSDLDFQLVMHWDGRHWSVPPQPAGHPTVLASLRSGQVWIGQPLQRWNGRGWTLSRPSAASEYFEGLTALSPNDVWAVGDKWQSGASMPTPMAVHFSCEG